MKNCFKNSKNKQQAFINIKLLLKQLKINLENFKINLNKLKTGLNNFALITKLKNLRHKP